jgi:hypothetical protein
MVLNKRRDVENGIRTLLREVGLRVGTPSRKDFPARVRDLTADEPVLASLAESLLSVVEVMTKEVEKLTKRVLDDVKVEPTCRRLMTVPGVGPLTALAFRATIDQPGCFRKSRDVGAHLGLTPRRYQSGQTDVQGRISRCGDELARTALYEAAHSLLIRSTKWSALRVWGMNIAKRRGMARARVAVARKLAGTSGGVRTSGSPWSSELRRPPHPTVSKGTPRRIRKLRCIKAIGPLATFAGYMSMTAEIAGGQSKYLFLGALMPSVTLSARSGGQLVRCAFSLGWVPR